MRKALRILLLLVGVVVALGGVVAGTAYWYVSRLTAESPMPTADPNTRRRVETGEIVGFADRASTHAWLGIPYAAPPLGDLRWRAPRPPEPWSDVRPVLTTGPQCPQPVIFPGGPNMAGEEDCLFLNVWTPEHSREPLPVMFWIHGGGNHIGQGGSPLYSGANLAGTHNVVVVTVNYRLGPLGWLSHPALREGKSPADDSGNYAVLDILRALKWAGANVAQFGGDPGNVTIFGESAGGFNVLAAMVSPLAAGLYHKAIVQSGGLRIIPIHEAENYRDDEPAGQEMSSRELLNNLLMGDEPGRTRAEAKAMQQAMPNPEIAAYLRAKTPGEILSAQQGTGSTPYLLGDGFVLPDDAQPAELFADLTRYNSTPVILGTNRDETKLFRALAPETTERLFGTLPYRVREPDRYDHRVAYGSDAWKVRAVDSLAAPLRSAQGATVFAYRFDWDELDSFLTLDLGRLFGAAHALEIPFVFGNFELLDRAFIVDDDDIPARDQLSRQMMSYWAEFAYTGSPRRGRAGDQVEWASWENGDDAARLLILDSADGGGIRMSPLRLTMSDLRARLLADTSLVDAKEQCRLYRETFTNEDFLQAEYDALGDGACPP